MRPVDAKFPVSQGFGSGATAGVDPYGTDPMAALVRLYGDYQPFGHAGMDIACPVGTPVYAMSSGVVLWADWGTNLPGDDTGAGWASRWYLYKGFPGIVTVIQHPWGIGVYAHLSNNDAAPAGTKVKEGQLIGYSGDTGGVAPHLHVEALTNLSYVTAGGLIYGRTDPAPFFGTLAPQSTATAPAKESTLSAAEVKQITDAIAAEGKRTREYVAALLINGYTIGGKQKPSLLAVDANTQGTARKTLSIVEQLAAKQGVAIDYAKVEAAAKEGASDALAEGVDLDATVTVKKAV
jgi:hypothetical protein